MAELQKHICCLCPTKGGVCLSKSSHRALCPFVISLPHAQPGLASAGPRVSRLMWGGEGRLGLDTREEDRDLSLLMWGRGGALLLGLPRAACPHVPHHLHCVARPCGIILQATLAVSGDRDLHSAERR